MLIQNSRTKQHVGPPPIRFLCPSRTFFRQKPSCTKTHEPKQNVDSPKPREPGPSTTLYYRDSNPIPRPQAPVLLCTTATRFQGSGPRPQYYCVYDRSPIPRPVSGVAPGPVLLSATATQFQELGPPRLGPWAPGPPTTVYYRNPICGALLGLLRHLLLASSQSAASTLHCTMYRWKALPGFRSGGLFWVELVWARGFTFSG